MHNIGAAFGSIIQWMKSAIMMNAESKQEQKIDRDG